MMNSRSSKMFGCLCLLLVPFFSACVWRTDDAEHYIGPVLFRYAAPPIGKAYVGQMVRLGLSAEAGTSWGLALGVSERIAVAPLVAATSKNDQPPSHNRWRVPLSFSQTPTAGEWNFSLLYLHVEREPGSFFISRTIHGAEIVLGEEANAFSIGIVSRTLFTPPDNTISKLHYERARPLESQAKVWLDVPEHGDLPSDLIKEITHGNAH